MGQLPVKNDSTQTEFEKRFDYGPRAARYLRVLGWINIIGLNLGGLLWLWFARRIAEHNNGFRKAAIVLLSLNVGGGCLVGAMILINPAQVHTAIMGESMHADSLISILLITLLIAIHGIPIVWLMSPGTRSAFERWRDQGLCAGCGYDLRATTNTCPECGRPTTK